MSSLSIANNESGSSVRTKLNSMARRQQLFAFDAANQADSLAHQTGHSVGDVVQVMFWDSARQDGGTAVWRAWQTGSGTIGAISNAGAIQGIQMQGNGIRWLLVPADGNRVDIRCCGVVCDGTTIGQESRVETLRAAAQARGLTLTGAGVLRITRTLDLRFADVDFSNLLIQAGTPVDSTTAQTLGNFYAAVGQNIQITSITRANPGVVTTAVAHGLADGALIEFGVSGLGSLPHELDPCEPYYVRNPTADTFQVATTPAGAPIDMTLSSVEIDLQGTAFVFVPPPTDSNFDTEDIQLWDGRITRKAYAVRAAGDGAVNDTCRQDIRVRGDGNFDYTTESTVIGIKGEGDDSPLGVSRYQATYCFVGATLTGAYEKKAADVAGTYLEIGVYMPFGTSADTINLRSQFTRCRAYYWEHDGISSSINVQALWESRDNPGDDRPYAWIRSGKSGTLSGVSRSVNGLEGVLVDKPKQFGVDHYTFALKTIDTYGRCVWIRRGRQVSGNIDIYDAKKGPSSGGTDTRPAFSIGRVIDAGNLHVALRNIVTEQGVEIGDATLYSRDASYGEYAVQMGNLQPVHDSNIDNPTGWLTGVTALRVRNAKGGRVVMNACLGNVVVEAAAVAESGRPVVIELPEHQARFTRTVDPAAQVTIGYRALALASDGKLPNALLPQNVVAGVGATATYNGTTGQTTIAFSGQFGSSAAGWNEAVLGSDFSVNTITPTAISGLSFTPVANKRYIVEAWIAHTANAPGTGVRPGITMPTGLTCAAVQIQASNGAASIQDNNNTVVSGNTVSSSSNSGGAVATMTFIRAMVFAGATPGGAVELNLSAEAASNQVTVLTGSVLRWRDIG